MSKKSLDVLFYIHSFTQLNTETISLTQRNKLPLYYYGEF